MAQATRPTSRAETFRRRVAIAIGGSLTAACLLGWWFWPRDLSNDPRIAEIRQLQEEVQQRFGGTGPGNLDEAREYVAGMGQIRQRMEELPPQLQRAAAATTRSFFFASMRRRIDDYYQAPPGQRQKLLDQHIKQSDLMRKAFEEARQQREATTSAAADGQAGGNASRGRGPPWANRSQDERNEWFKNRILDQTTPEQRARYVEYRRAETERREQLGLPSGWPR